MPTRLLTCGFLSLLAAQGPAQESVASDTSGPLAFAWGPPVAVEVTETVLKKGVTSKMRYRVELAPGTEEGELVVRLRDLEFLEVQGKDATTPAMKRSLGAATALAQAIPELIVDGNGQFLRAEGFKETIDRLLAYMKEQRSMDENRLEAIRRALSSAEMQELLARAGADF